MRGIFLALFLGLSTLLTLSSAHAADDCTSGMAALKMQMHQPANSGISKAIEDAVLQASRAADRGDSSGCMTALHTGFAQLSGFADKWMACRGGIVAMHRAGSVNSIMSVIEAQLTSAEQADAKGDVDGCLGAVHLGLIKVPTEAGPMDNCTAGRERLARKASSTGGISSAIQAAIDNSGEQLMKGDMTACIATVQSADKVNQ